MPYRYIEHTYGTQFKMNDRVKHTVTGRAGRVMRVRGDPQYYKVQFDGLAHGSNCHPTELAPEGAGRRSLLDTGEG